MSTDHVAANAAPAHVSTESGPVADPTRLPLLAATDMALRRLPVWSAAGPELAGDDGDDERRADAVAEDLLTQPAAPSDVGSPDGQPSGPGLPPAGPGLPPAGPGLPPAGDPTVAPAPVPPPADPASPDPRLPGAVRDVVAAEGSPLTPSLRTWAERGTGRDLGGVRIHAGDDAAASATAVQARAYTVGRQVVLGSAAPGGSTRQGGLALLAHEIGHVVEPPREAPIGRRGLKNFVPKAPLEEVPELIRTIPDAMRVLRGIEWDTSAQQMKIPSGVLSPVAVAILTKNYVVELAPTGAVAGVEPRDPVKTVLTDTPVEALLETYSGRLWGVGYAEGDDGNIIDVLIGLGTVGTPDKTAKPEESIYVIYLPDTELSAALVASLRSRARGGAGNASEAPDWAADSVRKLRRRRAAKAGPGTSGTGPGSGTKGTGSGGGGTADQEAGERAGDQPGKATKASKSSGSEPAGPPLRGPATYDVQVSASGSPQLKITIDRASTTVPLKDGQTNAQLDRQVDAAEQALQDSRDPTKSIKVAGGVDKTGFVQEQGDAQGVAQSAEEAQKEASSSRTAATPGQLGAGGKGIANSSEYPSAIAMSGIPPKEPAITVSGATNEFTMTLDYAARSFGLQDEVWNRLQTIQFSWEVIDVSGLTAEKAKALVGKTGYGKGEKQGAFGAMGTNFKRDANAVGEDQAADVKMMSDEDWPWEARSAYLAVIGLSNSVRLLGSIIGSFIDAITEPLNARSIGFERNGDYVVRCVATPQVSDAAREDPDHHVIRASSIAVLPIRVADINVRAREAVDREARDLAAREAKLAAVQAGGSAREIATATTALEAARKAGGRSGFETYQDRVSYVRSQIQTAKNLQEHLKTWDPKDKDFTGWSDEEVSLHLRLLAEQVDLEVFLKQQERALTLFAGELKDGSYEHESWVTRQHGMFRKAKETATTTDFRPRMALASEETGQVTDILCMLGQVSSREQAPWRWGLIDVTSPKTRDIYYGTSMLAGEAGRAAAVRDAFRNFAENSGYGRGTLAIRMPADLVRLIGDPKVDLEMRSAPGARGRALQRLKDLATVAEIVALFATGGAAIAIGAVGGIAGAIVAVDSLIKRERTGHLLEIGTIFDVLGVIGGLAAGLQAGAYIARQAAEAGRAAGRLPTWIKGLERTEKVLHIHAQVGVVQQLVTIPIQLALEWHEIDESEGTEGQKDSRRMRALLNALKTGTITVASLGGGFGEPEGSARPAIEGDNGLPPGTGAKQAQDRVDGTGPAKPPVAGADPRPRAGGGAESDTSQPPHDTSVAAKVEQAQELARRQLAAATKVEVEASAGGGRRAGETTEVTPPPKEGQATKEGQTPKEGQNPKEGQGPREGETDESGPTARGTPTRPSGKESSAGAEVGAAERVRAVEILAGRLGHELPTADVPPGPRPRPGGFGERTASGTEAVGTYDRAVSAARGAEVGLFFNPNTGEFAVQVGTEHQVRPPAGDGWQAVVHLHPNPENIITLRLPAPADISLAVRAALRTGSHTEFVQSTRPDGTTGLTKVTVTTSPRPTIVVEMPAYGGEPARRISVESPEAYAREYGDSGTFLDPTSEAYKWVIRDLDDFHRQQREESGAGDGPTAMGTVRDPKPTGRPEGEPVPEKTPEQQIKETRESLTKLREGATEPNLRKVYDEDLRTLGDLEEKLKAGEDVAERLGNLGELVAGHDKLLAPVPGSKVGSLAARTRTAAAKTRKASLKKELLRIATEAEALAQRMEKDPSHDPRMEYGALRRQELAADAQEYEVVVDLADPVLRGEVRAWFEEKLATIAEDPVGTFLVNELLRHLETADAMTLKQSPRKSTPQEVARTTQMREAVKAGIAGGRYPEGYVALFEAAARGQEDGWPRSPDGRAWEVDHVAELWLGGSDDLSNYLALPENVHDTKSAILAKFMAEFRGRRVIGEQTDVRATDPRK